MGISPEYYIENEQHRESKISEIDTALFSHESQLTSLMSLSQTYAQKNSSLKLEYERKVTTIEESLIEQNVKLNNHCRNLETQCKNLYHHIIQLTRKTEMLEEKPKRKKLKHVRNTNCVNNPFTPPVDINA